MAIFKFLEGIRFLRGIIREIRENLLEFCKSQLEEREINVGNWKEKVWEVNKDLWFVGLEILEEYLLRNLDYCVRCL